jgi:hypothetical protein
MVFLSYSVIPDAGPDGIDCLIRPITTAASAKFHGSHGCMKARDAGFDAGRPGALSVAVSSGLTNRGEFAYSKTAIVQSVILWRVSIETLQWRWTPKIAKKPLSGGGFMCASGSFRCYYVHAALENLMAISSKIAAPGWGW